MHVLVDHTTLEYKLGTEDDKVGNIGIIISLGI